LYTYHMKTIIVWYRSDLRIHDHPALSRAVADADFVVPVFIFDTNLTRGKRAGSNRNRFMLECLQDLRESFKKRGGDLVIREGDPSGELKKLAQEINTTTIHYTSDYTPYALKRDKQIEQQLGQAGLEMKSFGGKLIVNDPRKIRTKADTPHKVFTPFWKVWSDVTRRDIAPTPQAIHVPAVEPGVLPSLDDITNKNDLSPRALRGGETQGRKRLHAFLENDVGVYKNNHHLPGSDKTSRLSAYLHFGCLSPREIETILPDNEGARAWHRQLAWRDFYHHILFHYPNNVHLEFQEKYRAFTWTNHPESLKAWQAGTTGYPMVDAAMRQLREEGWMHNRGRLVVGSFLTKDLDIDWREGEAFFMRMLIDGDTANNNGNWQWIASVGVDPAPMYRRLYNPASQGATYDPDGSYVRRYVPELTKVSDKYLMEPWKMSLEEQKEVGCIMGKDYPLPIVDHKAARQAALEKYRALS
jgi:deoxyribodipyrimidine photo-lyase